MPFATPLLVALAATAAPGAGAPMVRAPIDAYLPPHLRPTVEQAIKAELDPKRGPENARQLLERAKADAGPSDEMSLQLRIAALELRRTFLTESKLDEGKRHEQALSTFTRLDLAEPGYAGWLRRTLAHRPDVEAAIARSPTLKVAVLARGPVERGALQAELRSAFERSGLSFELRFVPPDKADYLLKVATENLTRPGKKPAVGIRVVLESADDDALGERQRLSRALEADRPEAAAEAGARWVAHIAGRDLVARFLADRGLPMMVLGPLSGGAVPGLPMPGGHEGHGH